MYRYIEQLIDPLRDHQVRRPPVNTWQFFWFHISPFKWPIVVTLILAGISALSELYFYEFLGRLLDWMNTTPRDEFLATHWRSLLWMAFVVGLVRPITMLGSRMMINLALAPGIVNATRWQNHRYVLRQSMSFFQNDFAGRISQKVMQTGHGVREAVINIVDGAWLMLIYLVGISALLMQIDRILMLPILFWMIGYAAVIIFMVPPVRGKSAALSEATSSLSGRVVDSYTNIQSVKLFAHNKLEEDFVADGIRHHTSAFRVMMRAILTMTASITVLNTLLVIATAALSIYLWMGDAISVGSIAIANGLVVRLNQMSGWILRTITSLFENIGTVQNGIATLAQKTHIEDAPDAPVLQVSRGHVVFDKVSFRYDNVATAAGDQASVPIIADCSFEVKPGEKIGLVGRSGAGKSTLINLLMRFHDLSEGSVTIDGQDVRSVQQDSLRSSIAVVSQDTALLHRTIRDNIRYGRENATDEEIIAAATKAAAMEFIPHLSDSVGRTGLDAYVGERGVKLSGGQRQRIAIARVILKDAPILILDEATSALDSEVEAAIQSQLNQLMEGKTVLAVAHRLSTIAALDRLIVLDEGRVIESGTHQQLLENKGLYARLWQRQSGGFIGM